MQLICILSGEPGFEIAGFTKTESKKFKFNIGLFGKIFLNIQKMIEIDQVKV